MLIIIITIIIIIIIIIQTSSLLRNLFIIIIIIIINLFIIIIIIIFLQIYTVGKHNYGRMPYFAHLHNQSHYKTWFQDFFPVQGAVNYSIIHMASTVANLEKCIIYEIIHFSDC